MQCLHLGWGRCEDKDGLTCFLPFNILFLIKTPFSDLKGNLCLRNHTLCAFFFFLQKEMPLKRSIRKSKLHVQCCVLNKAGLTGLKKRKKKKS